MENLKGKVAIVTGASRGMGRRFVAALVAEGAQVACIARPSEALDSLSAEFGDSVLPIGCDASLPGPINDAVAATVAKFGRLDIVVNNVGIFHPFLLETATDEQVERHVGLNLLGPIWMSRAAIPELRKTKGQIVSISSESVMNAFPMLSVYGATKAGLESLSAGLREELRCDNIRVTVLRSGSVSGSEGGREWPEGAALAFFTKITQTGHAAMTGEAASPESMAEALISILKLPADVSADLIVVRAAREGLPKGAAALSK